MIKTLLSVCALVALCTVAQAASPAPEPTEKVMTGRSVAHDYWLADGLNRLVFWQQPNEGRPVSKPAH